jgi:hypothetical protein
MATPLCGVPLSESLSSGCLRHHFGRPSRRFLRIRTWGWGHFHSSTTLVSGTPPTLVRLLSSTSLKSEAISDLRSYVAVFGGSLKKLGSVKTAHRELLSV